MDKQIEYGIICAREDEKELVKRINFFLKNEYDYRKMYKRNDDSISTFSYEYYYFQFMHQEPRWFFDLYPNIDTNGKSKFENSEVQWVLWINKQDTDQNTKDQNDMVSIFFERLITAIKYPTIILHEYKDGEERIGNLE
jgi:hypothetical protein